MRLATSSRFLPRTRVTSSTLRPCIPSSCRNFSIEGDAAKNLFSSYLDEQLALDHASPTEHKLDISVRTQPFDLNNDSEQCVSLLLYANRRPVRLQSQEHYFGPALLSAHTRVLRKWVDDTMKQKNAPPSQELYLGKGGLGLLDFHKVSRDDADNLRADSYERPIVLHDEINGITSRWAKEYMKVLKKKTKINIENPDEYRMSSVLKALWKMFEQCEGVWFTGELMLDPVNHRAVFSKPFFAFDPQAMHRVKSPMLKQLYEQRQRTDVDAKAEDGGLFYIDLKNGGNIGSFGYGAGNAMGTMDGLSIAGGQPANFLDGGGGANRQNAKLAIETLNTNRNISTIFVNTFGGITQTDVVADGVIDAVREHDMKQKIVVRVKGTGSEEAKRKLAESGLDNFVLIDDFRKAASEAVRLSPPSQSQQTGQPQQKGWWPF